jgi:hypothetical protein
MKRTSEALEMAIRLGLLNHDHEYKKPRPYAYECAYSQTRREGGVRCQAHKRRGTLAVRKSPNVILSLVPPFWGGRPTVS